MCVVDNEEYFPFLALNLSRMYGNTSDFTEKENAKHTTIESSETYTNYKEKRQEI